MDNKDVELLVEDYESGYQYDITKAVDNVDVSFVRKGQATRFNASFHNGVDRIHISKGSKIMLHVKGVKFFKGYVAEDEIDNWYDTQFTCYDQLNYLAKNKASYNISDTATGILRKIASDYGLKVSAKCAETGYVVGNGNNFHSGESLLDIIYHALKHTLVNTQWLYNLFDEYGELVILHPSDMVAENPLIAGSNIFSFRYKGSINQKTYNRARLYYSNEAGMDIIGQGADDPVSQAKWGILGYYAKIDETAAASSVAGAQNMARTILAAYNREFKQIHIEAVGDPSLRAGSMVWVDIGNVNGKEEIKNYQLVDNATHHFSSNKHTMDIDVMDIDTLKR